MVVVEAVYNNSVDDSSLIAVMKLIIAPATIPGMARGDAVMAAVMLGFVQFWLILLWAFSRRSVLRTWTALAALALAALLALAVLGVPGGRA